MRCRRGRSRGWAVVCASYGRGVRLGLFAINCNTCADPESCVRVARAAEAAGFDSVWTGENLVLPDPRTPMSPLPAQAPMLDTVVAATWVAAHTSRIRIGTTTPRWRLV